MRLATICFCGLLFVLCFIAGWNVAPHRHAPRTPPLAAYSCAMPPARADGSQVYVRCIVERVYP